MNQITEVQELNALETLSVEGLQNIEKVFMANFEKRKVTNPDDYYFSDVERKTLDTVRFFITKNEHQNDSVKIGDMFYTSWGYDQTNTEHFQVVKISPTGKTCQVIRIGSKSVEGSGGFMCESVLPDPTNIINAKPCQVKIERSRSFNPITNQHEEIGEINLRGSVYYSGDSKHLENLYRCKGSNYRSWYA